jgi:SSS family solute:Na+ symporter
MNNTDVSMGITNLDAIAIAVYFGILVVLGFLTRRNKTFAEFALGKHSLPALMIFASLAATIVGPGFSVGFTAEGYSTGYLFYFLVLSYPLQTIVSGLFLAPRLSRLRDCATLGDVINKSYGRFAQFLTGIISVGLLIGFTAIMGKIGGSMLQSITGWPVLVCYAVVTGSTALLTFSGGLRATIATEAFQFSLFSLIVPVMVLLAVWQSPIDLTQHAAKAWELTSSGFTSMSGTALFGVALSFFFGEMLLPPYANRALAAQSSKGSTIGFVTAGLYTIVWLGLIVVLGIMAHAYFPSSEAPDSVFIAMGKQILPAGVYGVLLAAVIAIVMSSQESVLNSGAVSFVKDIVGVFTSPTEKKALLLGKISTLAIAAVAIYIAQFTPSIINGLLVLYSLWAPTIILPLIGALYGWRVTPASGWLSMILGGGASLLWQLALGEPMGIPAILVGLIGSLLGFLIGRLIHATDKTPSLKGA